MNTFKKKDNLTDLMYQEPKDPKQSNTGSKPTDQRKPPKTATGNNGGTITLGNRNIR